jgi:hypothetical protein
MTARRAVMVLAMLAALVLAPSSVFAASNELVGALVTPPAGTTATLFVFSVVYESSAGNAANGVTASAAGKTISLSLTSGSPQAGTWTGSATLSAGSWMVSFQASATKGPQPSATFGPVSVAAVSTPSSSPTGVVPSADTPDPGDVSSTAQPKPQASTEPRSSGPATQASGTARPSAAPDPATTDPAVPGGPGHGGTSHRRSGDPHASSSPAGAVAPSQPVPGDSRDSDKDVDQQVAGVVLLFGIAGVAAIALLGAAWILLATRRDRVEASVGVAPTVDPAITAIPTLEQRALRRARLRPSDDPILAALGLNDQEPMPPDDTPSEDRPSGRRSRRVAPDKRPEA